MARALCVLAACLVAAAALAGCAASGAPFDPIPSADWKPGYTFGYTLSTQVEGSARSEFDGKVEEESFDEPTKVVDERPILSYRVLDATTVDGIPVYLTLSSHRSVMAFRQADLQPLNTQVRTGADVEVSVEPVEGEHSWLRFPLERGDSWRGTAEGQDLDLGMGERFGIAIESEVYGMESVEGPHGPVDAVRIEHEFIIDEEAMERALMASAAEEGVEVDSLSIELSGSRTIHYAPSLHNIVRDETRIANSLRASFSEDGKEGEVDFDIEMTILVRLAEATFEETPSTPLSKLESVKPPKLPQPAPTDGSAPAQLKLTVSETEVNAADQPEITVSAQAAGLAEVTLKLVDSLGRTHQYERASKAAWPIHEPGRYTVHAEGYASNGYYVTDEVEVLAGYETTVRTGCGPVSLPASSCQPFVFPVRPGARSVEITALRDPLVAEDGFGTLYAVGSRSESARLEGNEATIRVEFEEGGFVMEDWQTWYEPDIGVLETIEYRIVQDYGTLEDDGAAAGSTVLHRAAESLATPWARPLLPG